MRISDWSSDVCSSDLPQDDRHQAGGRQRPGDADQEALVEQDRRRAGATGQRRSTGLEALLPLSCGHAATEQIGRRSEEHTSELQSLMRISYAVFCLKKKNR